MAFSSEPVVVALTPSAAVAAVVTALSAFSVWTPSAEQYSAILGLVAVLVAVGVAAARRKVSPTE